MGKPWKMALQSTLNPPAGKATGEGLVMRWATHLVLRGHRQWPLGTLVWDPSGPQGYGALNQYGGPHLCRPCSMAIPTRWLSS